ncbi:MAG: hypothetical protein EU551_03090 [Promethearchaeota archaeon]|nr:MAG: hypothetical protein EU551_03090 [Candidatus Lokiarchaeota archaeon]
MTAQIPDQFFYNDLKFDLVGIRGEGLYTPIDFGINTISASTACWRGFVMKYSIKNNQLLLEGFWINTKDEKLPEIDGIKPSKLDKDHKMSSFFKYEYMNIDKKIPFSGSIWLAKDFIDSEYVHMGFQSPSAYKTVFKFDIEEGDIIKIEDLSKQAELARNENQVSKSYPNSDSREDIDEWIRKRFSLDPDL